LAGAEEYVQRGAPLGCRISVLTRTELVSFRQDERTTGGDAPPGVEKFFPGYLTLPQYGVSDLQ